MRTKSLIIGYVLVLALFLFARRHPDVAQPVGFHGVVDLTYPSARNGSLASLKYAAYSRELGENVPKSKALETRLDAPATLSRNLWAVGQIPPARLVAPLVVLDVRGSVEKDPDYQLSVIDIADWERVHGEISPGSVVLALTGSTSADHPSSSDRAVRSAGYSSEAAEFLIEGRNVVGLGTDSDSIDSGSSRDYPVYKYALSRDTYLLENVADLDRAPASGGVVMVAPLKLENRSSAPVRILALAR